MKLLLCILALAAPMLATPAVEITPASPSTKAEDDARNERAWQLLQAQKRVEQLMRQDKLANDAARTAEMQKKQQASSITALIEVVQVIDGGILARAIVASAGAPKVEQVKRVTQVQGTGLDSHNKVKKESLATVTTHQDPRLTQIFFLRCDVKGLTDGEQIARRFWPAGTHRYPSVNGSMKTVKAFTTTYDPEAPPLNP